MSQSLLGNRPCATTSRPEMSDAELSALKQWLQERNLKGNHLEIGTAAGGALCFMMNCYSAADRPPFVVVDTMSYFQDQMETVKRNLRNQRLDSNAVDFRVMTSDAAFELATKKNEPFDFILVDASHKIRYVTRDLRWMRLLNVGGIACFHDYSPRFKGVTWPIDRFLRRNTHFRRVGQAGSLLCIRKAEEGPRAEVSPSDLLWAWILSPLLQWELSLRKRIRQKKSRNER